MFCKAFKLAETERPVAVYLAVPEHINVDNTDYGLTPLPRNVVRRSTGGTTGSAGGRSCAQPSGRLCSPPTVPLAATQPRRSDTDATKMILNDLSAKVFTLSGARSE